MMDDQRLTGLLPDPSFVMARSERSEPGQELFSAEVVFIAEGVGRPAEAELLARMMAPLNAPPGSLRVEAFSGTLEDHLGLGGRIWVLMGAAWASRFPRGRFHEWQGIQVIVTESLSDLLAQPALKRAAWEDLKLVMQAMGWKTP
jgi:hypothetical protein